MFPHKLFGFELIEKLVHLVGIQPFLETLDESADLERRGFHGFFGQSETDPLSLVPLASTG